MRSTRATRHRLFVLTDISREEPDDLQSLIRLLLYSNEIEIEGLVATSSEWKSLLGTPLRPDLIHNAIDAYGHVRENLLRHDQEYPDADALRAKVRSGCGNDLAAALGPGISEGAELLAKGILSNDPRPLWVAIWGGAATLAQAVNLLDKSMDRPALAAALSRLWVHEIQGQDDCGAWLARTYPEIHYIRSQYQWRGMSNRVDGAWPEPRRYMDEYVEPRWFGRHVREGHGPMGELYPHARFMFEGDTPSFLNLVDNGLNDPFSIGQGSWGGRFLTTKTLNVWSGGCPVNDEGRFGDFAMYTDAADKLFVEGNGKFSWNVYNPLRRWRAAYQNDFAARMDWCVQSPETSNHAPVAVVEGAAEGTLIDRQIGRDSVLEMDAAESHDTGGHSLEFRWWLYNEAGDGRGLELHNADKPRVRITADAEATGIHQLILELTNSGEPPLKSYRRIRIKILD